MNAYAINTVPDLKSLYISLGIHRESFSGSGTQSSAPFNAAMSGGRSTPDGDVITANGIIKAAKFFYAPTDGAAPFDSA